MRNRKIICIGGAAIDIPLIPVTKEVFDSESHRLDDISLSIGGSAINESVILSRLGYQPITMIRLGEDILGRYVLEYLQDNQVDTQSVVVKDDSHTQINVGLVRPDGSRTFIVNRNGSAFKMCLDDIDFSRFHEAEILSLASIFINPLLDDAALTRIFAEAKKTNIKICADIMKGRDGQTLKDIKNCIKYIDYFFPNNEEAAELTGFSDMDDIADCLIEAGVGTVVITRGREGCFIKSNRHRYSIPVPMYDAKMVDTIGAGDNFVAGFITGLLDGLPIEQCGQFANAVATISIQSRGATSGVRSRYQVDQFIQELSTDS